LRTPETQNANQILKRTWYDRGRGTPSAAAVAARSRTANTAGFKKYRQENQRSCTDAGRAASAAASDFGVIPVIRIQRFGLHSVWREAFPGNHVCVTPDTRAQAAQDNQQAQYRESTDRRDYGKHGCEATASGGRQGRGMSFVSRQKFASNSEATMQ
jgi:hypothetical protein